MARLDAKWDNFINRGQTWDHFWQDTSSTTTITYSQFGQSQSYIVVSLSTYTVSANAQANIIQTYISSAQSQAVILQYYNALGQAQSQVVETIYSYANSQGQILVTSYVYANAQSSILSISLIYAQAQANILITNYSYAQALSLIILTNYAVGNSVVQILQVYQAYGQARLNIFGEEALKLGFGQALAWIGLLRLDIIYLDTFSRVTTAPPFDLGYPDIGPIWTWNSADSGFTESTSPIHADGNYLIGPDTNYYDSLTGPPSIESGEFYFDFWLPASSESFVYKYFDDAGWFILLDYNYTIPDSIYVNGNDDNYTITPITNNSWYRVHATINLTATDKVLISVWKIGDTEPVQTAIQTSPDPLYYSRYFDIYLAPYEEAAKFDNFKIENLIIFPFNQGYSAANVHIKSTNFAYAQVQVILNQYIQTGQSVAQIISFNNNTYSQAETSILKSAGYGQALTRVPYTLDSYGEMVKDDGAIHLYGLHYINEPYAQDYEYWKDEIGIWDVSSAPYSYYAGTISSPVYPEKLGISLYYYRSYKQWNDATDFDDTKSWTIDGWVKSPPNTSVEATIYSLFKDITYRDFSIYFGSPTSYTSGSKIVIYIWDGSTATYYDTGITYQANTWYYIAITYTNKVFKVYINTALTNTITKTNWTFNTSGGTYFNVSYDSYAGGYASSGNYLGHDNIAIYPLVLDEETILRHYVDGLNTKFGWAQTQAKINTFNTNAYGQSQVIINQFRCVAQSIVYISPAFNQNVFGQSQVYFRITSNQNEFAQAQTIVIPLNGLLEYFIQGSSTNYSLPDQGTYAEITSITADTGPAQPNIGDLGSNYGIRWQSWFVADMTGDWYFKTTSDDGSGIFIYDEQKQLVGQMNNGYGTPQSTTTIDSDTSPNTRISLVAGTKYKIDVKYAEGGGGATIKAWYRRPGDTIDIYLTDGEAPWIDKSRKRYWGIGLANALPVQINPDTGARIWPQYASTNARIYLKELNSYGQANVQVGAIRPAQAVTRVSGTGVYELAIETDLPTTFARLQPDNITANQMAIGEAVSIGIDAVIDQNGPFGSVVNPNSKAVYLDGSSLSEVNINTAQLANTFTIELWAKSDNSTITIQTESTSGTDGTSGQRYLWYPEQMYSNAGLGVSMGTNGIGVYEHGSSYLPPLAVYSASLGTDWHHIVITHASKISKIYLDGVLVRTGLTSLRSNIYSPINIGGKSWGNFAGTVAEPAIYDYVLSDERILAHYVAASLPEHAYVHAQALAKLWAYKVNTYGQSQGKLLSFNQNVFGLSEVWIGHFQFGLSQAYLKVFNVNKTASVQALIIKSQYRGNAQAWIKTSPRGYAQATTSVLPHLNAGYTQAHIKQTFPRMTIDVNYATVENGAIATDFLTGTQYESVSYPYRAIDNDYYNTSWLFSPQDVSTWLKIDFGQTRTVNYIGIVPFRYDATVEIQYSTNNSSWSTLATVQFAVDYYAGSADITNQVLYEISPISARYWRLLVVDWGTYGGIGIAAFILGYGTMKSPTFAQAQAILGYLKTAQAIVYISPAMGIVFGQTKSQIRATYQRYSQANTWMIPATHRGQAVADILQVYTVYANVLAFILPPTAYAQTQTKINAFNINRIASSKASIKTTYGVVAQAKADISKFSGFGQANVSIKPNAKARGYALAVARIGHLHSAQAIAYIVKTSVFASTKTLILRSDIIKVAQSRSFITVPPRANAQAQIKQEYIKTANALAITNMYTRTGFAKTLIVNIYAYYGNSKTLIKQIYNSPAQAGFNVRRREIGVAQAVVKTILAQNQVAQALVYIGYLSFGAAQAQIIAFNVPKAGIAGGYILADSTIVNPPSGPSSEYSTYLVRFNGYDLPGYVQSESYESALNIEIYKGVYIDGSLIRDMGVQNTIITLEMLLWENTYQECKEKLQKAATIMRSFKGGFAKLFIQRYDVYYLAIGKSIKASKTVGESVHTLRYTVEFEAKPWTYNIDGTSNVFPPPVIPDPPPPPIVPPVSDGGVIREVFGLSNAKLLGFNTRKTGFAQAHITVKKGFAITQARISKSQAFGQTKAGIKNTYKGYGQASVKITRTLANGQAIALISALPKAPSGLTATPGDTIVILSWTPPPYS